MFWLILAYPVLTHAAVWLGQPWLQWAALSVLAATAMFDALLKMRRWAWVTWIAVSLTLFALVRLGGGMLLLYIPPILLPGALLVLFARSLRPGSKAIITQYAEAIRGSLPDDLAAHTRSATKIWCVVLAGLVISGVSCALFASAEVWSVMTNLVHYLVLGATFLCEYLYRRLAFRNLPHPGFVAYIRALFGVRLQRL